MSLEIEDKIIAIGSSRIFLNEIVFYSQERNGDLEHLLVIFLRNNSTPIKFSFAYEYKIREIVELLDKELSAIFVNNLEYDSDIQFINL